MKKKLMITGVCVLLIVVAIAVLFSTSPKWSEKTFEAVVGETVTMPDGEKRLIVERTTEIYASPLNSLCISEETKLVGADGKTISAQELQPGSTVKVSLKDSFVEETPFYYPDVYEIRVINTN